MKASITTKQRVPSCRQGHEFSSEIQLDSGNKRNIAQEACFGDSGWQAGLSRHYWPEKLNVDSCVAAVSQERAFGDQVIPDFTQVLQGFGLAWEFIHHHSALYFTDCGQMPKASLDLRGDETHPLGRKNAR